MTTSRLHSWQEIHARIKNNIVDRKWCPGDLIPGEVELAKEYGCSRTTVNRALRELASTGVIDRKRRAGTRVSVQESRQVRAQIPVIRAQVEAQKSLYHFKLLENNYVKPSIKLRTLLNIGDKAKAMHLRSIHFADNKPFVYEDRWINIDTVPDIKNVDLAHISANEWLVYNVPFTSGEFVVEAVQASSRIAKALSLEVNESVLTSRRTTWLEKRSVTTVKLHYKPGFQMQFEI